VSAVSIHPDGTVTIYQGVAAPISAFERMNVMNSASSAMPYSHPNPESFTLPYHLSNAVLFARRTEHGIDDCLLGLGLCVHPRVS